MLRLSMRLAVARTCPKFRRGRHAAGMSSGRIGPRDAPSGTGWVVGEVPAPRLHLICTQE